MVFINSNLLINNKIFNIKKILSIYNMQKNQYHHNAGHYKVSTILKISNW